MSGSMAGSVDDSAAAGDSTAKEQLVDNPLAKRAKVTAAVAAGDQDVDLLAAAEAGLLPRIKIARQNSSSSRKQQATDKQTTLQPKQQVKRSSSSKRTSKAAASSRAVRLVPKPAAPSELVPPPTADEIRRNNSRKTRFTVREILAHRVGCEEDQESAAQILHCII